jgi:hypothetical protein
MPENQIQVLPIVESPTQQAPEMRQNSSPIAPSVISYAQTIPSPSSPITKRPIVLSPPEITDSDHSTPSRLITEQPRGQDRPMSSSSEIPASSKHDQSRPQPRGASTGDLSLPLLLKSLLFFFIGANNTPPRDPRANCLHGNHEMEFHSSQAGVLSLRPLELHSISIFE